MEDSGYEHHHYWPGEGTIPLTPQAVRYGYVFPVHVTRRVWSECISWMYNKKHREVSTDTRIIDLLHAAYVGMGKALTAEPDRVFYQFHHWFWNPKRPTAKKKAHAKYGARLLLDPETEEPWLLLFDPDNDGKEVLEHGEPEENRGNAGGTEPVQHADGTTVDQGRSPVEGAASERSSEERD